MFTHVRTVTCLDARFRTLVPPPSTVEEEDPIFQKIRFLDQLFLGWLTVVLDPKKW